MKSRSRYLVLLFGLSLLGRANAELADMPTGAYSLDKTHGYITFSYSHMGFSTPHVGFREFDVDVNLDSANIENSEVSVLIDATSIDSRVAEFDEHLNGPEYFATADYPEITFNSTALKSTGDRTFDITGDLTIKGTTVPVTLNATLLKAANHPMRRVPTLGVVATAVVSRSEFGLDRAVPIVGDAVTIEISVELPQAKSD